MASPLFSSFSLAVGVAEAGTDDRDTDSVMMDCMTVTTTVSPPASTESEVEGLRSQHRCNLSLEDGPTHSTLADSDEVDGSDEVVFVSATLCDMLARQSVRMKGPGCAKLAELTAARGRCR